MLCRKGQIFDLKLMTAEGRVASGITKQILQEWIFEFGRALLKPVSSPVGFSIYLPM